MGSLSELIKQIRDIDDDMLPAEFDPAEVVGDIKEKVDAIKWRIDTWEAHAKMIDEEYIKALRQKREAILGKVQKLKEYVQFQMVTNGFEKLPGAMFRVQLQNSPKSVETKEFACAKMFLNYPEYVVQETTYKWNKESLKESLENGEILTFAELKQGKHVRFYATGEKK